MAKNSIASSEETKAIRADVTGESVKMANLFNVKGTVALVTGGQRGIGYMIAKTLVANGARVYISSRNRTGDCDEAAAALTNMGPGSCFALPADLASDADCKDLAARLAQKESTLHSLWVGVSLSQF